MRADFESSTINARLAFMPAPDALLPEDGPSVAHNLRAPSGRKSQLRAVRLAVARSRRRWCQSAGEMLWAADCGTAATSDRYSSCRRRAIASDDHSVA